MSEENKVMPLTDEEIGAVAGGAIAPIFGTGITGMGAMGAVNKNLPITPGMELPTDEEPPGLINRGALFP